MKLSSAVANISETTTDIGLKYEFCILFIELVNYVLQVEGPSRLHMNI